MIYLLYTVHLLVCVFLNLVVLLQHGKGADLSVFGGGSTQTAFGSRGTATFLHKLTVTSFVIFVLTTLAIGIPQFGGGGSVLRGTRGTRGNTAAPLAPTAPGSKPAAPAPGAAKPAAPAPAGPAAATAPAGTAAAPASTPATPATPAKPGGQPPPGAPHR